MTNFTDELRKEVEEDALQALAEIVDAIERTPGGGQATRLVKFVASLYNGMQYQFDLTDLRGLDTRLVTACLAYLRFDARGAREIHHYIPGGAERLNRWFVDYGLRAPDRSLRELGEDSSVFVNAELVSTPMSPGYRSLSLVVDMKQPSSGKTLRADMQFSAEDSLRIRQHIVETHRAAWGIDDRGPIDRREGEKRPAWLSRE